MASASEQSGAHDGAGSHANYPDEVYSELHSYDFASDSEFKLGLSYILGRSGAPATNEECNLENDTVFAAKAFYFSKKFGYDPHIELKNYKRWLERNGLLAQHRIEDATNQAKQEIITGRVDVNSNAAEPPSSPAHPVSSTASVGSTAEPAGPIEEAKPEREETVETYEATTATTTTPTTTAPQAAANAEPGPEGENPAYPTSFARIVELITTGQPIPGIQQIPDTVLTGQGAPSNIKPRRKPWEKEAPKEEDDSE
ncbi:hypothetical protein VTO42DRAFT_4659 [Malbranchea cinnamomea]